ncbi:hypothetical protein AB6A40_006818 [Gnathostoma spinigerum]|uniref:Uncharacterized protein n=1 Tax=Gnathostoma spinigerum TaxID=75299 RepID=A0ABD6EPL7_9BILA
MECHESFLYAPYKSVGEVCSSIAPAFRTLPAKRKITSVLCPVGNVVLQYSAERLRLVSISDPLPSNIQCVAADKKFVYAAAGSKIALLHLSRQIDRWLEVPYDVRAMIPFGEVLVVIDVKNTLHVVDIEDGQSLIQINSPAEFTVTAAVHPATYINKVLIGSASGTMRLINVKTSKLVYEFYKPFDSAIDVFQQSPVVDVIAVGLRNGQILIHNLKFNETVMSFQHDVSVTAISFRNDGVETMTSACVDGTLAVWDLNKQKLIGQVPTAHTCSVTALHFLCGEPIMVSAGSDNKLITWIYDMGDHMPRKLVCREGHSKPVTNVCFDSPESIVTAGLDGAVFTFSVTRDTQRHKLGNAGIMPRSKAKKLGLDLERINLTAITEMSVESTREAAWDNLLCAHENSAVTTTWTTRKLKLGSHRLLHKRFKEDPALFSVRATCVCVTPCGNFGVIGYSSGHIDLFNLQSGKHRRSFSASDLNDRAHSSTVCGVFVPSDDKELVSVDVTGSVRFWDFHSARLRSELHVPSSVQKCCFNRSNHLLVIGVAKGSIGIVDVLCRRTVRVLRSAHSASITAIDFSPDGKWIASADEAGYLKIWDVMTCGLIDVMKFPSYCTSLHFSPSGKYLATSHHNQRAVYIFVNKLLYSNSFRIKVLPIDYEPGVVSPSSSIRNASETGKSTEGGEGVMELDEPLNEVNQISELVTLSGFASSRWVNLPILDLIRERNKPIQPVSKPKLAPFFLPSVSTLEGFEFEKTEEEDAESKRKRLVAKRNTLEIESTFAKSLMSAKTDAEIIGNFDTLKWMNISSIDFHLRSLPSKAAISFLRMLLFVLRRHQNFDLVQSYLATFLGFHRDILWQQETEETSELTTVLLILSEELNSSWDDLDATVLDNSAMIQWIKSAVV